MVPGQASTEHDNRPGGPTLALSTGLFFLWGVANNLNDVLVAHFRALFRLGDFQSGLVQSFFYLGYFCFAIPAALVMRRFGFRVAIVVGLLLFAFGALLFWPASAWLSYPFFLLALFVIASGLAFLETAANPMVAALGSPATADRRLTFAQAFNPLGSIAGVVLGLFLILSDDARSVADQAAAVRLPYLLIAGVTLLWALLIARAPFPAVATRRDDPAATTGAFAALARRPRFLAGVAAQFFYVGAQVGIWSFLIRYATAALPGSGVRAAAGLLTVSLVLFMAGRFVGAALMRRVSGARLLLAFALADAVLCAVAALVGGVVGVACLVGASAFMSIMYPTIFVLALRGLGPLAKPGASLIVMAIIGGAVLSALMGWVSDMAGSIRPAMLVPAASFLVVALFAANHRRDAAERAA